MTGLIWVDGSKYASPKEAATAAGCCVETLRAHIKKHEPGFEFHVRGHRVYWHVLIHEENPHKRLSIKAGYAVPKDRRESYDQDSVQFVIDTAEAVCEDMRRRFAKMNKRISELEKMIRGKA
jgi:hypothetical protein